MKVALATTSDDPLNPRSWSGTPYTIYSALKSLVDIEVVCLGPLNPGLRIPEAVRKYYWQSKGQRYLWEREPRIIDLYRKKFNRIISKQQPDVTLSLGTIPAGSLPSDTLNVVYIDTTFQLNLNYYPTMMNICPRSQRLGEMVDRKAFGNADHVICTSAWAADSLVREYGVPSHRISIVPIGAQHVSALTAEEIESRGRARLRGPLRLLWVGVEWERKGGDIAVEIARNIFDRGIDVELHIVGLMPGEDIRELPFVKAHGFIDSRKESGVIEELFANSFALLLPSRAENTSVVISDSASFGLPVFASDTGGMATMIVDGVNGELFRLDALPSTYASRILDYRNDPEAYASLVRQTRSRFDRVLSWDVSIQKIRTILDDVVASRPAVAARH